MEEFFREVARDELEHAGELAERIVELGGLPSNNISNLAKNANASYPGVMKDLADCSEIIKLVEDRKAGRLSL